MAALEAEEDEAAAVPTPTQRAKASTRRLHVPTRSAEVTAPAASFRLDSPADAVVVDKDPAGRDSSLTRGYATLGVELHAMDGADEPPSSAKGRQQRRHSEHGQRRKPLGRSSSSCSRGQPTVSAMMMDLEEVVAPVAPPKPCRNAPSAPRTPKPRSISLGALHAPRLKPPPALSSKASLPSLPNRRGAADPLASWKFGSAIGSRSKLGFGLGIAF